MFEVNFQLRKWIIAMRKYFWFHIFITINLAFLNWKCEPY
jgi:hypothetical protein